MVPRSIIHKPEENLCLFLVSSYFPLLLPTFPKLTLKCLNSSIRRCREDTKRSKDFKPIWKRQQRLAA